MTLLATIYKRGTDGKIRTWQAEINGPQYRTIAGGPGRKPVTSAWTTCIGKQGRTDDNQAAFEANAAMDAKLKREYRKTEAELATVAKEPMLAHKYEGGVTFPVFSQPKLDGIRAKLNRHGAWSRENQRHWNAGHIDAALGPIFAKHPEVEFDGEFYNHDMKDDFGKIVSIVRKQSPTDEQRAEARALMQYHVYDLTGRLSDGTDVSACPFSARRDFVGDLIGEKLGEVYRVVTRKVTDSATLDYLYEKYLADGYEGQMVRLDAPYEHKRSKSLLKRKEFLTDEFKLLYVREGQGNWAGFAKQIIFELSDGRECGAGVRGTQDEMKALLAKAYLGAVNPESTVTIRYFTPTPDGMPRFPVAIDFHFDGRKD